MTDPTRLVLQVSRELTAMGVRTLSEVDSGVTVAQHRALLLVASEGTLSIGRIAELLGVDQSRASRHCSRLAGLGLVDRRRSAADGRATDVSVTERGRDLLDRVERARLHEIGQILSRLDRAGRDAVAAGFEAFDRAATDAGRDA